MTVPGNIDALLLGGQRGYQIERSLRFNSADSAYLSKTPTTPTNNLKWTFSCWVKRSALGASSALFDAYLNGTNFSTFYFTSTNELQFYNILGGVDTGVTTTGVYRDLSAWYHIVFVFDSANATAADRAIIYVNGTRPAQTNPYGAVTSSEGTYLNNSYAHSIGRMVDSGTYLNGYLTETYLIDGQALTPSSFGETDTITGVWKPKKYAGTYTGNSFYLKFADNSGTTSTTLGKDSSGLGNNWTPNNFSVTAGAGNDSMIDTPTPYADGGNGRGNYCTWLPQQGGQTWTFSNGNLDAVNGNFGAAAFSCIGTIAVSTGKWYWEVTCNDAGPTTLRVPGVGIMGSERDVLTASATIRPDVYLSGNGTIDNSAGTALQSGFSNMAAGDVVGVAVNADAKTVQFYRNGSAVGTAQSYTPAFVTPSFYSYNTYDCNANFGQRPFAYTPPAGFLALNTQNLPEPSIKKGNKYFDLVTYQGTGTTNTLAVDFSSNFAWIKRYDGTGENILVDTLRGTTPPYRLFSNSSNQEATTSDGVNSFSSTGVVLDGTGGGGGDVNQTSRFYWAAQWDGNGTGSSNTAGSITSTVSANPTAGFSIATYSANNTAGATFGHGLGVAPSMVIIKKRNASERWVVYHKSISNQYIYLNETFAGETANAALRFGNDSSVVAPSSTLVTIGTSNDVNGASGTYVAYCFSEVAGYSKFGSYTGNGSSSDGPFIFCGFKPKFIIFKGTASNRQWSIMNTVRIPYNGTYARTLAESNLGESGVSDSATAVDFLSNGFKLRGNSSATNASGENYVFAAFAEHPFKYANAR